MWSNVKNMFTPKMAIFRIACFLFIVLVSKCSSTINNVALLSNLTSVPLTKEAYKGTGFVELATKYGYKSESHVITTEDGYILTIHRIPPKEHCTKKLPLFLFPNLHMGSAGFLGIAEQSPGFVYADDCYDVWFGNMRGTEYGRQHVSLNPDKDLAFWKFHVHQNAIYDATAAIDYILECTDSEKVIFIGYAQGSSAFFILNSEKPDYTASKVSLHVGMAPITRGIHSRSVYIRSFTTAINTFREVVEAAGVWEILSKGFPGEGFLASVCQIEALAALICGTLTAVIDAPHPGSIPPEAEKRIYKNFLDGTSVETVAYYGQLEYSKDFFKFDYGLKENLIRYGTPTPPAYCFNTTNVPVLLFQGLNDGMAAVEDTDWAVDRMPNVVDYIKPADPLWNHLDSMYSIYWKDTIYVPMKKYLEKYAETC